MKIVIPGGSGQVGTLLARAFLADGHSVVLLSRKPRKAPWPVVQWDGKTLGDWTAHIDGADVVINLAGRPVIYVIVGNSRGAGKRGLDMDRHQRKPRRRL